MFHLKNFIISGVSYNFEGLSQTWYNTCNVYCNLLKVL